MGYHTGPPSPKMMSLKSAWKITSGALCEFKGLLEQAGRYSEREGEREGDLLKLPRRERLKRIRCLDETYSRTLIELPEQLRTKKIRASKGILGTLRELREDLSVYSELVMEVVGVVILAEIRINWVGIEFLLGKGGKEAWLGCLLGIAAVVGDG